MVKPRCALITGASSGLGVEFARQLAPRVDDVVLVARRRERLETLAAELRDAHGCGATCIALDLTAPGACQQLHDELSARGLLVDVLVNNAGVGLYGSFVDSAWARVEQMLRLDVLAVAELTRKIAADMVSRGHGYVLQVASIAAEQPAPSYAAYSGAKAFVLGFSEALADELRGTGVSCTVVCPGVTRSEFFRSADQPALTLFQRWSMMDAEFAAEKAVSAMLQRRVVFVPGLLNKLAVLAARWLPRRWLTALAGRLMQSTK